MSGKESPDDFELGDDCEECGRLMSPGEDDGFGVCEDCMGAFYLDVDEEE